MLISQLFATLPKVRTTLSPARLALELRLALGFATRIPVRVDEMVEVPVMARALRWLPLVGALVGGLSALVAQLSHHVGVPIGVCAVLLIAVQLLLTGALHEDGLADVCDGLGGGSTRARKLEIMRDSRLGTYGVVALICAIALEFSALTHLSADSWWRACIVSHVVSRTSGVVLMSWSKPARQNDGHNASLLARVGAGDAAVAIGIMAPWVLMYAGNAMILVTIVPLTAWIARRIFTMQLGGITGDCIGALIVVVRLLVLVMISTFD